jgi:hypothetical protein
MVLRTRRMLLARELGNRGDFTSCKKGCMKPNALTVEKLHKYLLNRRLGNLFTVASVSRSVDLTANSLRILVLTQE